MNKPIFRDSPQSAPKNPNKAGGDTLSQAGEKIIEIGGHTDGMVTLDMSVASNPHIAIFGRSGSGKSVAGQKLIRNIVRDGMYSIVVFDVHHLFADENIFPGYKDDIKKAAVEIDAYSQGICLPLFTPLKHSDGRLEDPLDIITSITGVFSDAMRLGGRQKDCLYEAAEFVAERNSYAEYGIAALDKALDIVNDDRAAVIQDRMRYIFKKNTFRDGSICIKEKKINVFRLSKFPESTQSLIVEIVLTYIWRLANTGAFLKNGLCLFVDECQNLNWAKTGIISTILSEGRKLGLQLILITQSLGGNSRADIRRCLLQAGTQLYFSPPEDETVLVAKLIGAKRSIYWQMRLKTLAVGECVINGSLLINRVPYQGAIKVKI